VNHAASHTHVLNTFLDAFGERKKVLSEIRDYWHRSGTTTTNPIELYGYLIGRCVERGECSAARAEIFKRHFEDSFAPDVTTGYLPKHRLPLIEALNTLYTQTKGEQRLYRVEADIGNLGGLNRHILEIGGSRILADAVVRVMAGILREELDAQGKVTAIREGGDELCLFVKPNTGNNQQTVDNACKRAQQRIAEFIQILGLKDVRHSKAGKPAGVGIGMGIADCRMAKEDERQAMLEEGIKKSKEHYQTLLEKTAPVANGVDIKHIRDRLAAPESPYAQYAKPIGAAVRLLDGDKDFGGKTPQYAMRNRLERALMKVDSPFYMSDVEQRLLEHTQTLTEKLDFVTGLPIASDISSDLVPNFSVNHGNCAKLVLIDFNNIGGANRLGMATGDALSGLFKECVAEGMVASGFKNFLPYLASQGGGRFALLLPESASTKNVRALAGAIEKTLQERSGVTLKELGLSPAQLLQARNALLAINNEELALRVNSANDTAQKRRIRFDPERVAVRDIYHTHGRGQGSHAVLHAVSFAIGKNNPDVLLNQMQLLAEGSQKDITNCVTFRFRKPDAASLQKEMDTIPKSAKPIVEAWRERQANAPQSSTSARPKTKVLDDGRIIGGRGASTEITPAR
jgi:hypothetical protein